MAGDVLSLEGRRLEGKGYFPFLYRNIIVGNNLHLPILCPLKVTKKEKIDNRLIRIDNQINDIVIKINNRTKDIRGNDLLGRLFGVLQRIFGMYMKNLTLRVSVQMKNVQNANGA